MKILIAGDFVPRYRIASQIEAGDFSCLEQVKPIIQAADYSIVNFESPVAQKGNEPIDKTGPCLRCTGKSVECIAQAGFNCVTLANNHFRDYGQEGVENTLEMCRKNKLDFVGGGNNINEAEQMLFKVIDGKLLAIINVCENEWSIADDKHGGSAPLNPVRNYYFIKEAKKKADYVLVIVHGGIEGYQYPTPRMVETYRFFVDAGADAVVNHHQHCFSGYEVYHGKPIFYGLGNLCFDINIQKRSIWNDGYMVKLLFGDDENKYEIVPYIQCAENPNVQLMRGDETTLFFDKIADINQDLIDKYTLSKLFDKHISSIWRGRLMEFEPFSNKMIRALQIKRVLPSFVSKKTRKDVFNVINCESHREVILNIFKKILQK